MKTTTPARWTIALGAAAILALPMSALGQTTPPSDPPAATQPATPQDQPPAPQQGASADVAKSHLTAARNALSQITQLPAASQLQGEARNQVSQLINNFNELITTQSNWKSAYTKVESTLNMLLAPQTPDPARATGTPGAVGTSGTIEIDPSIRAKLVEFRTHLAKFEEVASGGAAQPAPTDPAAAVPAQPATSPTPPAQAPPTGQTPSATPTQPPAQTSPTAQTPPPSTPPPDARPDPEPDMAADPQELLAHVQAIETILNANAQAQPPAGGAVGTTGSTRPTTTSGGVTLTPEQVQELRTHLAELRRMLDKK